ncbi:hypothetical protein D0T84_13125 [Dysgonomonas sp. 521]|uniref:tetratricopeptide repeat protein n=1 Tax=Dysgonomonas sp. 521 TaxID=2302932 RepID=UPI0013D10404|nr:hypothetical protein [Dysgonomonas sp. 521]NDV95846.1 hypothetical protein [Dysgonomonas sp. 521]
MGLFDKLFSKKKEVTTEAEVLPMLQEMGRVDKPMGIAIGDNTYAIAPFSNMVEIRVNDKEPVGVYKFKFMALEDILYEAETYYKAGDYGHAMESVEQALTLDNKQPEENRDWRVYYLAGCIAMKSRKFDAAAGLLSTALETNGCPPEKQIQALNSIGACCSILEEKKNAHEAYLMALALDKENTETLHNIGGFYWDCNMLDKAAESYLSVLRLDINYIATYEEIGNLLKQQDNEALGNYFLNIFNNKSIDNEAKQKIDEAALFFESKKVKE